MTYILQVLNFIGGLALFLAGMRIMSEGIQKRTGERLNSVFHTMGKSRITGVLAGFYVTTVIQSSSATTVLLVSLVNAGLLNLQQSIAVIMGANIGTTSTAWLVSIIGFQFSPMAIGLPVLALSVLFYFSRRTRYKEMADICIGFGLLILGLAFMKELVPNISEGSAVLTFLLKWSQMGYASILLFLLIGAVLTACVRSSSATMAITIIIAFKGWIPLPMAAAVVLGENIGTTLTAFHASLPLNAAAKRAGLTHMLFNIFGVCWMLAVFMPFIKMIDRLLPEASAFSIPIQLSMFHTIFNLANTVLLLIFLNPFSKLVKKLIKDDSSILKKEPYQLRLVVGGLKDVVEANLITVRKDLAGMAGVAYDMLMNVMNTSSTTQDFEEIRENLTYSEQRVDDMQAQIISYLTKCTRRPLGVDQAKTVASQRQIANELESIADSAYAIGLLIEKLSKKGWSFHDQGDDELMDYTSWVLDFLKYNQDFLAYRLDTYNLSLAHDMEDEINKIRNRLRKRTSRSIEQDVDVDVKGELIFLDMVRHLEHIGDNSLNISEAIAAFPGLA